MGLVCLQPPAVEPVSLAELKEFLRIDADDASQDATIADLALDARAYCETFTARKFVQQQWQLLMDFFPGYIDMKLAGAKVSSPFVSGSNAVLVGIRYGIVLPFPPVRSIDAFVYQNANGQVSNMILGPWTIAAVTNTLGQPVQITTTQQHQLISGAGVNLAGNAQLLALLNNTAFQVVTVLDANNFTLNGTVGTGTAISSGGQATGYNFVQDILSNPARLTPVFGQVWPVARVVVNAVQVTYTLGYAQPVTVTTTVGNTAKTVTAAGYTFQSSDVGRAIWIPGAGPGSGLGGADLLAVLTAVSGSTATMRDGAQQVVSGVTGLLVNQGKPDQWYKIRRAIKVMTLDGYEKRMPRKEIEDTVQKILYPVRDLRM